MFNSDNNNAIDSNSTQFTDPRDNNTYKTQKIGSLVWFTENLRFKTNT